MSFKSWLAISLAFGALPYARPAAACDKSCDAACSVCCKAWSVRALCPDVVAVDASFDDYGVAERVAQGLNAQAASCSGDGCPGVRIACPGASVNASWKPVCGADARASDPALTASYRALLAQAETLLAAERVALADAKKGVDALAGRPDLTKKASARSSDASKELSELATRLESAASELGSAASPSSSPEQRTDTLARFEDLSRKVAERVVSARRLLAAGDNVDKGYAARAAKADGDRLKQAAAEEKKRAERAAAEEKKQREQAESAARKLTEEEKKRAARETTADAERRKAAELGEKQAASAALKAAADARKAQESEQKKQAAAAKTASDADSARTDAIATVAHGSSEADAGLLACMKFGAQADVSIKEQQAIVTIRQRLQDARGTLGASWSALKATEGEPDPSKQLSTVKKLRESAERAAKQVSAEREKLKELVQHHASSH